VERETMSTGIRAEVKIDSPSECPVAQVAESTDGSSYSISKSVDPGEPSTVTEEFMLESDASSVDLPDEEMQQVFTYGEKDVYRFRRPGGRGCPCERIEEFGCPVVDVYTRAGELYLVFHAPDMAGLQDVITRLREAYPNLDVQRLLRSDHDQTEQRLVFVDRSSLTARQQEVLETAHRMGYFEHPKQSNAGEVADALGITTSTFTEHLSAAQRKLLGAIVES
jgi:hypothetical protein